MNLTLKEMAQISGAELVGDESYKPTCLCGLDKVIEGGIAYAAELRDANAPANKALGALIVPSKVKGQEIDYKGNILYVANPEWAFTLIMRATTTLNKNIKREIHKTAVVAETAKIGANVAIGALSVIEDGAEIGEGTIIYPQVYVGRDVKIGKNCIIYPKVTIREECVLKDYVILQPGAVIGSDGFGYVFINKHEKIPQIGKVILQDDVEIGANTCIDKGTIENTVIGEQTKIDNLVQIGHNCKIGKGCMIVSQVGIAGSCEIGDRVVLAGQAGLADHIKIGADSIVAAQAGVTKSFPEKSIVVGSPAVPRKEFIRQLKVTKDAGELIKKFKKYEPLLSTFESEHPAEV